MGSGNRRVKLGGAGRDGKAKAIQSAIRAAVESLEDRRLLTVTTTLNTWQHGYDAFVRDQLSGGEYGNYGNNATLEVKTDIAGYNRWTYLHFDLDGIGSTITSASLKLTGNLSGAASETIGAYGLSDPTASWNENDPNGIDWGNKPALASSATSTAVVNTTTDAEYTWNVKPLIESALTNGRDYVTIALKRSVSGNSTAGAYFDSGEFATESTRPKLVIDHTGTPPPPPPPTVPDFRQDDAGLVSMEAENFTAKVDRGPVYWQEFESGGPSGASGGIHIQGLPDGADNADAVFTREEAITQSPRADYTIEFTQTGTHYVWVRGSGESVYDDSVHIGLDGAIPTTSDDVNILNSATSWQWRGTDANNVRLTFDVPTTGLHTLNLFLREGGVRIDKLEVAKASTLTPTGTGDPETPYVAAPTSTTPTANGPTQITVNWTDNSSNEAGFTIQKSTNGGTTWTSAGTASANATSHAVTGLSPSTTYHFQVRGYKDGGVSAWSTATSAATPALNQPPTVGAPTASLNAEGTAITLSVVATDDGGEPSLTYTWSTVAKPQGTSDPTFSVNGTNSAKSAVATVLQAGSYSFEVAAFDGTHATTATVNVVVDQKFASIEGAGVVLNEAALQLIPADQFGDALTSAAGVTWDVVADADEADGAVTAEGLYTAPIIGVGADTVRAVRADGTLTTPVTIALAPPNMGGITAGLVADSDYHFWGPRAVIRWPEAPRADEYVVEQIAPGSTSWEEVGRTTYLNDDEDGAYFAELPFVEGQFQFRMTAVNAAGSSTSNVASLAISPLRPTNFSATIDGNQVQVSWTDNSLVSTGFVIERAPGFGDPYDVGYSAVSTVGQVTTAAVALPEVGVVHRYRVRAVGASGLSYPSNSWAVVVPLAAPTGVTAIWDGDEAVDRSASASGCKRKSPAPAKTERRRQRAAIQMQPRSTRRRGGW